MQNNSSLISSIHNSREILLELLNTQGYDTSEYNNSTLTETNAKYSNDQLDLLFDKSITEFLYLKVIHLLMYHLRSLLVQQVMLY